MPIPKDEFVRNPFFAGLIIAAVVAYLIIFHFLLGMTWMIYVLVLAVVILILIRKLKVMKAQKAQLSGKSP